MNFAKSILSCAFIGFLLGLTGCAKKNYSPRNVPSLKESAHVDYQETKGLVTLRAKAFTKFDSDTIFGERADRITEGKNPLQPIQISIENNSPSTVELLDANIDLSLVRAQEIADRLSGFNYKKAGIYCGIGALVAIAGAGALAIMLPFAIAFGIAASAPITAQICNAVFGPATAALVLGVVGLGATGGLLLLATPCMFIIDNSGNERREIRESIAKTEMGKTIMVNSGKTVDVLLFVQKNEYKPTFTCTLTDQQQNKQRQFEVHLPEQK